MQRIALLGLGVMLSAALAGCGNQQNQFVKGVAWDIREDTVQLGLEFNKDIQVNTDLTIPIKEYGDIRLISGNGVDKGFQIAFALHTDAFVDTDFMKISRTRMLPNGQPMSDYVSTDVGQVRFQANDMIGVSLYLGLDPAAMYLGAAIELGYIDNAFPAGLVLSQRIRDSKGRMLGVITVFGPKIEGGVVVKSGGLFFITNVTELVSYGKPAIARSMQSALPDNRLMPDEEMYIDPAHRREYSNPRNQLRLFDLYRKQGQRAGYVD